MDVRYYWIITLSVLARCYADRASIRVNVGNKRNVDATQLPDLDTLFSKEIPIGTKYHLYSCEFELAKDGCKITFLPKEDTCKDIMSLTKLTTFLLKSDKINKILSNFITLSVFQIERFYLDSCKRDVEFEARSKEAFEVIREKIKVKSAQLLMNFNYINFTRNFNFKYLAFDLRGEYDMFGNTVPITLYKQRGSSEGEFTIKADTMKVSSFISIFTRKPISQESATSNIGMFTDTTIKDPTITGTRDANGSYEIILRGSLSGLQGFDKATLYVIAQKNINERTAVALLIDVKDVNAGTILTSLTNKDLNSIPLLKESTEHVVLEYANRNIMMLKDPNLNRLLLKYISHSHTITKGAKLKVDLPIKKILQKARKGIPVDHIPNTIYVQVYFFERKITLKFPDNYLMNLYNMLVALVPQVPDEIFTNILKVPPKVIVTHFDVNIDTKAIDLLMSAPRKVVLGKGLIQLGKANFKVSHKPGGVWDFSITGSKMIDDAVLNVEVMKMGKDYIFQGKIRELSMNQIANHFGGGLCADEIFDKMKFLDFMVKDVTVLADFTGNSMKLRVEGRPLLYDWDTHFEGFLIDTGRVHKMAFGIVFKNIHVDDIVKRFYNKTIAQANWIRDLAANIIISNSDEDCEDCKFLTAELKGANVRKGAFLSTELLLPDDCKGEAMCDIIKDKMKSGSKLFLDGEINDKGLDLRAPYKGEVGLSFGMGFVLEDAVFCVQVDSSESQIFIEGLMKINDPELQFKAKVVLAPNGQVELQLGMTKTWTGPMRLKYITFIDVRMEMNVSPGKLLNKLEMTGKLHIGGNFTEIISYSTIGLSITNPLENFFYADIGAISLPTLLGAFNMNLIQLPEVLYRTSFPEGLVIGSSANPAGKRIDHLGVQLEMGLMLKGIVNILDLKLHCKLVVSAERRFDLSANVSILRIAGDLITIRRSVKDIENGPLLHGAISMRGAHLKLGGYVELLGMGSEAVIDVSNDGMQFSVYGSLFKTIETNLTVKSPSFGSGKGSNVSSSDFYVSASLSSSIKDVTVETVKAIMNAAEVTDETFKEAEEQVKTAGSWYNKAVGRLDKWQSKMAEKQELVQCKSRSMDNIKGYLDTPCTVHCKQQCIGGFSKKKNCTKLFDEWISCPMWNCCKQKIENPFCLSRCQGRKMYLRGRGLKKKVTMEILSDAITIIQKILNQTKEFVNKSTRVIELAGNASTRMEEVAASGKRAMDAIAQYPKEKLINIDHIGFNTTLDEAADSCIDLNIAASLGSEQPIHFSTEACLGIGFVKNIGIAIADRIFPKISCLKDKLNKAKELLQDAKNEAIDMDKLLEQSDALEKEIEGKIEEVEREKEYDDEEKSQKKDNHLSTRRKTMKYIRRQIYSDLPTFVLRDDDIMDAFKRKSPWAFSQSDSPFTEYINGSAAEEIESHSASSSRALDNLSKNSKGTNDCRKTKDAVNVYAQISDTISLLVKKSAEQKKNYQTTARVYAKTTADIEKEIAVNCQKLNMGPEEREEAMFFVSKLKDGVADWLKTLDKQLALQEKESIGTWRNSLTDIVTKRNIDMKEFLKLLNAATDGIAKRYEIANSKNDFGERLKNVKKLINDLLMDNEGTLNSKRNTVGTLVENVYYLKEAIDLMKCV